MGAATRKLLYDVHPGVAMVQKWVDELKAKTGKSLEEWVALAKKEGPKGEKERREWLKSSINWERTAPGGLQSERRVRAATRIRRTRI
jgi:hypothetical protein